jgi:pseudouridine kinase
VVTDGQGEAVDATARARCVRHAAAVEARRITGAGDTFMAAHIAAELAGQARQAALRSGRGGGALRGGGRAWMI